MPPSQKEFYAKYQPKTYEKRDTDELLKKYPKHKLLSVVAYPGVREPYPERKYILVRYYDQTIQYVWGEHYGKNDAIATADKIASSGDYYA